MTLPASGPISFSQVSVELNQSSTSTRSLNDSIVRTLFGVPSGTISMSQGYGKSNQFSFTISSNQTNANLRTLAINAGWNQSAKLIATINSGVYISSNATNTPALTVNGSFPNGVELVNNGFIVGMGGSGGTGRSSDGAGNPFGGSSGASGGGALSVSSGITVQNNGTIGGGGGGGGGGGTGYYVFYSVYSGAGGGGGGGKTGATNSSGGAGGVSSTGAGNGSSGGAGTSSTAGGGGSGGGTSSYRGGNGGSGGGWGAIGSTGNSGTGGSSGLGGGGAGYAVSGNTNVTWISTGTRLGSIA